MSRLFWAIKVMSGLTLIATPLIAPDPGLLLVRLPFWCGQVLVLTGCSTHLGHYFVLRRRLENLEAPTELITTGGLLPWIRHPMYLGDLITMLGFVSMWPTAVSMFVWAVGSASAVAQALVEDRALRARFPEAYARWARQSGLLLPRP